MSSVDFKTLRDAVDIARVADWLNIELSRRFMSSEMRGPCPVHGGGKRALVVNTKLNRWSCWAPECRRDKDLASGDAIQLAAKILHVPVRDAAMQLQSRFLNTTYRKDFTPSERLAKVEEKLAFEHECVQALGFSPEQARALGIGYMAGGTMPKRLLVPIRNREGDTLGFIGLSPDADIKRPKAWFNG